MADGIITPCNVACGSWMTCHAWNLLKRPPHSNSTSGFDFDHRRSRHVILHQSVKFHPNRTAHGTKITSYRFSRWQIFAILDFMGPIMGFLKIPCRTSYRSSVYTTALNCFAKSRFYARILATDGQTHRWTAPTH